ncbi:DUF4232 domain-containing protein [Pseudonocardia hispaniensis]|uniref:DUF4232 domain-containing protein n=1 Tax=Pseudonocardia hispaniensis TaxID=904933 RepID=A0ABW1J7U8_9PSEU
MTVTTRGRIGMLIVGIGVSLLTACSSGTEGGGGRAAPPTTPAAVAPPPGPTPAPAPGPAGTAAGTPPCTAAELGLTLGEPDAAAGSVHRTLIFTNTGSRTCALIGFPGVSYVAGDDGHQVGPAAERSGPRGGEVRIEPGTTAVAGVQMVQVANFDAAACGPTPVRGLRVYPPGETHAMFVPMAGTGCAGNPPGPQLTVTTVTAP